MNAKLDPGLTQEKLVVVEAREREAAPKAAGHPAGSARTGRIVANSAWTTLDMAVGMVCAILSSVLVARTFGPALLGYYSYIMWLIMMTSLVGRTGIPTAARRYFAQSLARNDIQGTRRIFKALMTAQCGVALLTVLIALGLVEFTMPRDFHLVGILGVIAILPSMVMGVVSALNSALERLAPNTQASIVSQLVNMAGVVATIKLGFGLQGVIGSLLLSRLLDLALRVWLSRQVLRMILFTKGPQEQTTFDPAEKRDVLRFILQAVFLQLLGIVVWDRSEIIFLKSFSPIVQLAFYSIPFTMTLAAAQAQAAFATAATTSLFVVYAESEAKARAMLATIVKYMALLSFPLCMGLAAVSNPLLHFLYGEKYLPAIPVLLIVAFFGAARSLFIPAEQYLIVSNRQDVLIYTTIGAAVVDLSFCIGLIPTWGAVGAAWANSLAQVAALLVIWVNLKKAGTQVPWGPQRRIGACALTMFAVSWSLARIIHPPVVGLIVSVIGGALTYFAAVRISGSLNDDDSRRMLSLESRVPVWARPHYEKLVHFLTGTPNGISPKLQGVS